MNPEALRNIRRDRCLVDAPYAAVSTGFKKAGAGRWEDVIPGARAAAPIHIAAYAYVSRHLQAVLS